MTTRRLLLIVALTYIGVISILFMRREGIVAGYLTMPGWFLVGGLFQLLPPGSMLHAAALTWAGNFVLLMLSAAVNVAAVYFVIRVLPKL